MWWWIGAALAIEPGTTEVLVERLTPEMHWFATTAISAEAFGCSVGVPVSGDGKPYVGCWFPSGVMSKSDVPREMAAAARRAESAVRESEGGHDPIRNLHVRYEATERRAFLCDHALLPNGLWTTGQLTVGIQGAEAHAVPVGFASASGGEGGLLGCTGRPLAVTVPADVAGRSILGAALIDPSDTRSQAAVRELLTALPAAFSGVPLTPSEPRRPDTVPAQLAWSAGKRVPYPGGTAFAVQVPPDPLRHVGTRVTWLILGPDGVARAVSTELMSGLPDDWSGITGPEVPTDSVPRAVLEVFATDVPAGHKWTPEAQGFERLWTSTLMLDPYAEAPK